MPQHFHLPHWTIADPLASGNEQLDRLLGERLTAIQESLEALAVAAFETGGVSIRLRMGTETLNFPSSALATAVTPSHGLGRTPERVFCSLEGSVLTSSAAISCFTSGYTATTFNLDATASGSLNGNVDVHWLAIG